MSLHSDIDSPAAAPAEASVPPSHARHATLGIRLDTADESAMLAEIAALAAEMRALRIDSRANAAAIRRNLEAAREAWTALRSLRAGNIEPVTPTGDGVSRRGRRTPSPIPATAGREVAQRPQQHNAGYSRDGAQAVSH